MSEWQPIETAPKDGRRILIATRSCIDGVTIAKRLGPSSPFFDDDGESYVDATHWQPLPKPPVAA